jgi:hypothetical protein
MKNIMLSLELFIIYFSTICWLMHKPERHKRSKEKEEQAEPKQEIKIAETKHEEASVKSPSNNEKEESGTEQEWEINFDKLSLKACRKIASELSRKNESKLGISQKVNRKDKPVAQLRREIKSRYKHYQEEVEETVRSHCNDQAKVKIKKDKTIALRSSSQKGSKTA